MWQNLYITFVLVLSLSGCSAGSHQRALGANEMPQATSETQNVAIKLNEAQLKYYETYIKLVEPMEVDPETVRNNWEKRLEEIKEYVSKEETMILFEQLKVAAAELISVDSEAGNANISISFNLTMQSIENFMDIDNTLQVYLKNAAVGATYEDCVVDVLLHAPRYIEEAKESVDFAREALKILSAEDAENVENR